MLDFVAKSVLKFYGKAVGGVCPLARAGVRTSGGRLLKKRGAGFQPYRRVPTLLKKEICIAKCKNNLKETKV